MRADMQEDESAVRAHTCDGDDDVVGCRSESSTVNASSFREEDSKLTYVALTIAITCSIS